jgi:fermentation-respiration switch protein FrsA (DUF1100 family)
MKKKSILLSMFLILLSVLIGSFSSVNTNAASSEPSYPAGKANVTTRNKNLPTGDLSNGADNWYTSDKVTVKKITFKNEYNMKISGNLFVPKDLDKNTTHPAIIVGAPMGAVKEQSANLYATKMAEYGFVTLSFDQAFWGDSDGSPKNSVAPDIYAESFSAAADYLTTQKFVNKDQIGVLGICGSGSFAISEAKIDSRLKAIATVSMYDMGEVVRSGIENSQSLSQRKSVIDQASNERTAETAGKATEHTSGTPEEINPNSDAISKEFYDFYRTQRGAANTTTHPTFTSFVKFMNFYPFNDIDTISPRPMLFIAGENAHSRSFSEEAYAQAGDPKELYIVPNAGHVDLYDRTDLIPFDKLNSFFSTNLEK